MSRVLQNTREVANIPPLWGRGALQKLEKNRNFKIEAKFGGLWGKIFQGFWPRAGKCFRSAHWLMCEQNEAGLLSTVPPPEGIELGPIEKVAPPHAKIGGLTPIFRFFLRGSRPPTNPENCVKIAWPIFEKIFFRKFDENLFFGVRGTFHMRKRKILCRCASSPLPVVQIWPTSVKV